MRALPPAAEHPLFVYGTLLDEEFLVNLLEHAVSGEPARLLDFELLELVGLPYPTAFYAPGERIEGRLYRGLVAEDFVRVDFYEGVAEGLYVRVEAQVVAGEGGARSRPETAFVYVITERTLRRYGIVL